MLKKPSWKTTLLGMSAAAVGILASDSSPAPKPVKQVAQVAGWLLVGMTGKAAQDHQEE
jgi:hypothetical protein